MFPVFECPVFGSLLYMVSVCYNFYPNYFGTGQIEWAEIFFGHLITQFVLPEFFKFVLVIGLFSMSVIHLGITTQGNSSLPDRSTVPYPTNKRRAELGRLGSCPCQFRYINGLT